MRLRQYYNVGYTEATYYVDKQMYIYEFEGARLEYNNKLVKIGELKITLKMSESKNDIASEIIELGNMDFWNVNLKDINLKWLIYIMNKIKCKILELVL